MEQVEVKIGAHGFNDIDDRELVRFQGEKFAEAQDPKHKEVLALELYACPGGYRVLMNLRLDSFSKEFGLTAFVVAPNDLSRTILSEEEVRERAPFLLTQAGIARDLDAIASQEKQRVKRFSENLELLHSVCDLSA